MQKRRSQNNRVSEKRLGLSAKRNFPLFSRIVTNPIYATRLVQAIESRNMDLAVKLILRVVPGASVSIGSGFGSDFNFSNPAQIFGFGIFRPGKVLRTNEVRQVAKTMLPIIAKLRSSQSFRLRILRLFRQNNEAAILRALRIVSKSSKFISVIIDQFGFAAVVQLPNGARYNAIFTIAL